MRAIWKGAVSFGLVNIPVRLYTATEERDVSFHQVHREDGGRIRYRRVCEADGQEVAYADIAKGFELPDGEVVILTDADFEQLPLPTSRIVDVLRFVPLEQVDPIYFAKSYYLEPDRQGAKPYILLRDALEESGMVALVKVAIRSREALGTLRVREGVLVLETMVWPDEVRTPEFAFLEEKISVRSQELSMATSLIDSMAGDFDPSEYRDEYRGALEQVIEAKIEGREVVEPVRAAEPTERAGDLMAALRRSVDEAKRRRGEAPAEEEVGAAAAGGGARPRKAAGGGGRKATGQKRAAAGQARKEAPRKATAGKAAGKAAAKTAQKKAAGKKAAAKSTARKQPARKAARRSA